MFWTAVLILVKIYVTLTLHRIIKFRGYSEGRYVSQNERYCGHSPRYN